MGSGKDRWSPIVANECKAGAQHHDPRLIIEEGSRINLPKVSYVVLHAVCKNCLQTIDYKIIETEVPE